MNVLSVSFRCRSTPLNGTSEMGNSSFQIYGAAINSGIPRQKSQLSREHLVEKWVNKTVIIGKWFVAERARLIPQKAVAASFDRSGAAAAAALGVIFVVSLLSLC